jgi:fucose 4-O-acetylase-like acetyltransferase
MARERFKDIDKAKGIAIFLVVLGHITLSGGVPRGAEWYDWIRIAVYKFHMPFFMYLSGYTLFYTLPEINSFNDYWELIKRKAFRLLPPLILFGVLIGAGKYIMQSYVEVDRVPSFSYYEFLKIIVEPMDSFARSIWYIYVLFEFYLTIPVLLKLINYRLFILLIIGLSIYFFRPTEYFAISSYNEYFLYFVLGMISVKYRRSILDYFNKFKVLFLFLFLLSFLLLLLKFPAIQSKLIISLLSIPALHSLMDTKLFEDNKQVLLFAKYTFVIYLLNTITIGLTKGIIIQYLSWDGYRFLFFAPIILIAGLYGPILIKKYFLSKVNYLDKITN